MNTPTHTPGPWAWLQADIQNGEGPILSSATGEEIVLDMGWPEDGEPMTIPNEGDRALIAAAPELLEALKYMLSAIDNSAHFDHLRGGVMGGAFDKAHSAIEKATGTP